MPSKREIQEILDADRRCMFPGDPLIWAILRKTTPSLQIIEPNEKRNSTIALSRKMYVPAREVLFCNGIK